MAECKDRRQKEKAEGKARRKSQECKGRRQKQKPKHKANAGGKGRWKMQKAKVIGKGRGQWWMAKALDKFSMQR